MEEDEGDPFEGMNNAQIAEIYNKMKPEDRRLFRQFKSFHKLYHNLHRHDAPSLHLARGIVSQIFSGLPARDAETIANARAELLAMEQLKELCKQLGLAIPAELQMYQPPPEAPEYPPPPQPPRFPSRQEKASQATQSQAICGGKCCTLRTRHQARHEAPQEAHHIIPRSTGTAKNVRSG